MSAPILYRCTIAHEVYYYSADGTAPSEFDVIDAARNDVSDPDVTMRNVQSLREVPADERDCLPHGIGGDETIADLATRLWPLADALADLVDDGTTGPTS